jgi:hypothetical protein
MASPFPILFGGRSMIYADRGHIEFGAGIEATPQSEEEERIPTRAEREGALKEAVLENIGTPDDLSRIEIKQLWSPNKYRINVYRIVKKIEHMTDSFFVSIGPEGVISEPEMTKKYWDSDLELLVPTR